MNYNNKNFLNLFHNSPYFIKNLISSFYGYKQKKYRDGIYFKKYFDFLNKSQWWTNNEVSKYSEEKTIEYVNDIMKSVRFYKETYNLTVNEISDIFNFNILDKKIIRIRNEDFKSTDYKHKPYKSSHTSGTTGTSLSFPLSIECFQREFAFRALHYSWGGINLINKDKIIYCAGHPVSYHSKKKPPFWIHDYSNNWLLMSSYHLSNENLKYYISKIEEFQPKAICGYPSSIYLLALAYKKYSRKKLNLKSIFTSSETLLKYQRRTIENNFETKVFNWYGNAEMCANIVECEKGELHLKQEHSYVEILNDQNKSAQFEEPGRLICTAFGNKLFGLIRYDIGDHVSVSKNQNSKCGRSGLLIEHIEGRSENYIVTPDGKFIGRLDHVFKDSENVLEAQLEQTKAEELIVRIVKNNHYNLNDERNILDELRNRTGKEINIIFEYAQSIPRGPNNKFNFIISKFDKKDLIKI
jgi:phenylacetate-CoA ligase